MNLIGCVAFKRRKLKVNVGESNLTIERGILKFVKLYRVKSIRA